jgi:ABC-type uncharacterized transport system YnjBCD ATPase subunit
MADDRITRALVTVYTRAQIVALLAEATAAYVKGRTKIRIVSQSLDGTANTGALPDDPAVLMDACQAAIDYLDGLAPTPRAVRVSFIGRRGHT